MSKLFSLDRIMPKEIPNEFSERLQCKRHFARSVHVGVALHSLFRKLKLLKVLENHFQSHKCADCMCQWSTNKSSLSYIKSLSGFFNFISDLHNTQLFAYSAWVESKNSVLTQLKHSYLFIHWIWINFIGYCESVWIRSTSKSRRYFLSILQGIRRLSLKNLKLLISQVQSTSVFTKPKIQSNSTTVSISEVISEKKT